MYPATALWSIFTEGAQRSPIWTPDGTQILYQDAGTDSLVLRNANGTGTGKRLTGGRNPDLSADGRSLVYHIQGGETQEDVWYMNLDDNGRPVPLLVTPAREHEAAISPDGKYVAYASDESGQFEVYMTRCPSAEGKWQVSTNGGTRPRWGRDGGVLYYQEESCDLMEVEMTLEPTPAMATRKRVVDCSEVGLTPLFGREYEVDVDGQRFLWIKQAVNAEERIDVGVTVVENWASEYNK